MLPRLINTTTYKSFQFVKRDIIISSIIYKSWFAHVSRTIDSNSKSNQFIHIWSPSSIYYKAKSVMMQQNYLTNVQNSVIFNTVRSINAINWWKICWFRLQVKLLLRLDQVKIQFFKWLCYTLERNYLFCYY